MAGAGFAIAKASRQGYGRIGGKAVSSRTAEQSQSASMKGSSRVRLRPRILRMEPIRSLPGLSALAVPAAAEGSRDPRRAARWKFRWKDGAWRHLPMPGCNCRRARGLRDDP